MYCVTFIAMLTHAVWEAPRKAVTDQGFLVRYQFAFGKMRPSCWWWVLVTLWESLALVGLQLIGEQVQYKIYFLAFVTSIMQILIAKVRPCRYKIVNLTEDGLYSAFALFLLTITAFIAPLDASSRQQQHKVLGVICLGIIILAIFEVVFVLGRILGERRGIIRKRALGVQAAYQLRDAGLQLGALEHDRLMYAIKGFNDYDLELLQDVHNVLVAKILDANIEHRHSRTSYSVLRAVGALSGWDAADAMFNSLHRCLEGVQNKAISERTRERLAFVILMQDLRDHLASGQSFALQGPKKELEPDATQQCFVNHLQPLTQISPEDLALIFCWLFQGDNVTPEKLTQELLSCMEATPQLSQERRDTLHELLTAKQTSTSAVLTPIVTETVDEQEANLTDVQVDEIEYCGVPHSCSCTHLK